MRDMIPKEKEKISETAAPRGRERTHRRRPSVRAEIALNEHVSTVGLIYQSVSRQQPTHSVQTEPNP